MQNGYDIFMIFSFNIFFKVDFNVAGNDRVLDLDNLQTIKLKNIYLFDINKNISLI
jgi:hypothetical protein